MKDQKKHGVILSYINLAVNMLSNVFLTPLIITSLGDDSYSIYKVMQSFAGPLVMFNLGVSTIVTRAIVKYNTLEEHNLKEKQNTLAIAMLTSAIMSVVVALVGFIMYNLIPPIYGKNYTDQLLGVGQRVFLIFLISTIFHILTDSFNGCAIGNERYVFNSFMPLVKNILRLVLIIIVIKFGFGAIQLALIDCFVSILIFVISAYYSLFHLKEFPKLTYINKRELAEMLSFSLAILLQAIVNQVNNNLDTMILGAMISKKYIITMYSSALLIYSVYNSLVSVMASFFLPKATILVTRNAFGEEMTDFVIRPGRYQAMIAVAIIFGFAICGKDFISIWIGKQYEQAYYVALMLMIPITIPLVENTAISILDASLKRIYRSVILVIIALINIIVSVVLVYFIGFWGAAIGTVISVFIGHILLMNIYYKKTFDMNIKRMFIEIFKGILPMGAIAAIICLPVSLLLKTSIFNMLIKAFLFMLIYLLLLWKWGINRSEKTNIISMLEIFKK